MQKLKYILVSVLLLTFTGSSFLGEIPTQSTHPKLEARQLDQRAKILSNYFAIFNSPLQFQSQDFIDAADTYNLDWKLVPAISGVESTFGKASYGYNAWGWGIYGNQALGFTSWKDGIYTVSEGLKKGYIDQGLTNPILMNRAYATSPSWGWKVNFFMNDLEKFAAKNRVGVTKVTNPLTKTAAASALLAFKW